MIRVIVAEDGVDIGAADFPVDRLVIGSREGIDLRIHDPEVAEEHAELWMANGRCHVRALTDIPLLVSGETIPDRTELTPNDVISLARVRVRVELNPEGTAPRIDDETRRRSRTAIHMKLGDGVLDFSQAEGAQGEIEQAKAILREQGAPPHKIAEVSSRGAAFAREIIERADKASLGEALSDAAQGKPTDEGEALPKSTLQKVLLPVVALAAVGLGGTALFQLMQLLKALQE